MDKNIIKSILEKNGFDITLDERYKTYGYRIKLVDGTAVFCYDKGTYYCQGKNADKITLLLEENHIGQVLYNNRIFIVYGHDEKARDSLIQILEDWGLEALLLDRLPIEGRTIVEQLEQYIPQVNYGVVLATPDDVGREKDEITYKYRARQNVILELGMLFSKLGRSRVSILFQDILGFEKPSDIEGILYIPFKADVSETKNKLRKELIAQGYHIAE